MDYYYHNAVRSVVESVVVTIAAEPIVVGSDVEVDPID